MVLAALGKWNLTFLTRDQTHILCIARRILNHWTTREVPANFMFDTFLLKDMNSNSLSWFSMFISGILKLHYLKSHLYQNLIST